MESEKNSPHTFKICAEKRLAEYLRAQDRQVQARIDQDSDDYLANADEVSYIQRLVNEFYLAVPYLDFGRVSASTGKKRVPAERFPPNQFDVRTGQSYEKAVVIFHIPCTGDVELLRYYTDSFIAETGPLGFIEDNHLCFEIINFHDDLTRVKKSSEAVIKDIKTLSSKVIGEIESHNYSLEWNIRHSSKNAREI